jgi:L-ascorbate metabolism protein UlaG (beta-lactamase superfamily)
MRRFAALLLVLCSLNLAYAAAAAEVKILYVANEGFLIEIGSTKVLIDAMFVDKTIDYCHIPSEETLAQMSNAEAPFDDVDLVLVTHGHRDHFAPGPVLEHLDSNPDSVLVGPPQAIEQLKKMRPGLEEYGGRIREIDLELFQSTSLDLEGIQLQVHRIHHSEYMVTDEKTGKKYNRHEKVENLAYVIEIDGMTLLHVGDAVLPINREYLEAEHLPENMDFVFLEYFDWSDETREILQQRMKPDHVVFMHLPREPEKIERLDHHLSDKFPGAVIFREQLQVRTF